MAGSKHGRSGGSGGSGGDSSPLETQLQQAWLQTQMPKASKRSFVSVSTNNSSNSNSNSNSNHHHHHHHHHHHQSPPSLGAESQKPSAFSALKSLSSLFPELANVPEEKKAMISSVFEENEHPVPMPAFIREKKARALKTLFVDSNFVSASEAKTQRSLSASVTQQSSGSLDFSEICPLSSSFSFSGSRTSPGTPGEELTYPSFDSTARYDDIETVTEVEVQQEKKPLFSYITEMLMDEKLEEKKCMFVEMTAYQAMAKELGDLISGDSPPVSYDPSFPGSSSYDSFPLPGDSPSMPESEFHGEEDHAGVDSWIEEILGGPPPAELKDSPGSKTELGNQCESEGVCTHTDSQFCGSPWKDADSEAAECQSSHSYLDSRPFDAAHGMGRNVDLKPVAPSSSSNGEHQAPVDLINLLIRCAQAVEQSDFGLANELINELRQHSSAYGNGHQRMAHYFMEALVARMSGTGGQLYSALSNKRPSEAQMLKAQMLFCEHLPFIQVPHLFANHAIMEAFKGASRVHVIDYGILYGVQWPCLLWQLSQRPGGPPHLRITGIDRPQPGFRPSARIQDTGRRLARLAQEMGVPFEFHAIAEKWEAITPAHLFLREDEVLVVNCMFRFRHLLDESVTAASPRNLVLSRIKSLNPKIFVQGVVNAGYNAPFFMSRFQEALSHFSTLFNAMESSFPLEYPARQLIDHEIVGREILNVVACEGLERVERTETYRQWQARTMRAGFQQRPTSTEAWTKIRFAMRSYHRDYGVGEDGHWFLLGWKGHITQAMTVWEPIPDSSP